MSALCEHYGWPPDFWRRKPAGQHSMGWLEFRAFLREMHTSRTRRHQGQHANPSSWAGAHLDPWHQQNRARWAKA